MTPSPTATDIVANLLTAGGVIGFVIYILRGHRERIEKLECFKGNVRMPNVGESMCDERHGTIEKGLKYLLQEHQEFMKECKVRDREMAIVSTELKGISRKLDNLNHAK